MSKTSTSSQASSTSTSDRSNAPPVLAPAISRIKPRVSDAATQGPTGLILPKSKGNFDDSTLVQEKTSFATLDVAPWLVASLSAMAITKPTGIQKGCIQEILNGKDVIGGSRTGSGKTVAFAVPILQKWAEDPVGIFAVVLTPTRELALQIFEQIKAISAPQSLKPLLITGGADMRTQALALSQRPHIIIATPGRLADHITTSGADTTAALKRTRIVVLDEADRLLASGPGSMLPDIETCLSAHPLPHPPPTLHQTYLQIPTQAREAYLHTLLLTPRNALKSTLIFTNRTQTATLLSRLLHALNHRSTSLHSLLPQAQRTANLARFRARAARILVATDVASRGLDIPDVELVVNYDVPRNPDDYVHRVGRTARAGRKGEAITMVGQRDVALVLAIEERVGRKMEEWKEEGVNVETRVVREGLKVVGERKREVVVGMEEGRDERGNRIRGKIRRLE
ncbi:MAG: ATP-dependent RNA helicase dbp8 [Lasallia pustulata]|uniref:ATP-dependent RNA helicase dbp8 n=1 Tax=Lasallia pustulata TaxID=136370 RepID=A0A5M8PDU2_9LECA|nr:MAG: ATP-dependent RNA helicase dbp8 [Lasallia pustulata]